MVPKQIDDRPYREAAIIAESVSFESFLRFFGEIHAEWLTGTVMELESKTIQHQSTLGFLMNVIAYFVDEKRLGTVLPMGVPMYLGDDLPAREPDMMVIFDKHKIKENYVDGPANVVIEIVSASSTVRDRGDKFCEYETDGVKEYWLVDPRRKQADIYTLSENGYYRPRPLDAQGRIQSGLLPGLAIAPVVLVDEDIRERLHLIEFLRDLTSDAG